MTEIEAKRRLKAILESLNPYTVKLGLERVEHFLSKLGNPQNSFPSILVGGTNGKGSVCQYLSDCLVDSGLSVGTYTSPHLILLNERIKINNRSVDFATLLDYAEFIKRVDFESLTYFEFLTVLAFLVFKEFGVDMAVLEVGMGGEFDATNVVEPVLSVITSISKDHEEHLGSYLVDIAKTKSKIIKRVGVVSRNPDIVVETIKKTVSAPLYFVDEVYLEKAKELHVKRWVNLDNVAVSILALDVLRSRYGLEVSHEEMRKSFLPARFEVIEVGDKTVVIDGAHNVEGLRNLKTQLKSRLKKLGRAALVFSSLKTKNWRDGLSEIMDMFEVLCFVKTKYRLSEKPENLADFVKGLNKKQKTLTYENVNDCINNLLSSEFDTVVFAGSLYLAGEVLACSVE